VADIVRAKRNVVWGVLWRVNDKEAKILDRREGVAIGSYAKVRIAVQMSARSKAHTNAWTYIVPEKRRTGSGLSTNKEYAGYLLRGAKEHKLPKHYVGKLKALWEAARQ
jgi:cation transport regulator ChaC